MQQLLHIGLGGNKMKQQVCKGHVTRQTLGHLSLIHCCHLTFYAAIAKYKYVANPLPILFNILIGWNLILIFNLIIIIVEERFEPMLLNLFCSVLFRIFRTWMQSGTVYHPFHLKSNSGQFQVIPAIPINFSQNINFGWQQFLAKIKNKK